MADYSSVNVIIGVGSLNVDGTSVGYTAGGVSITQKADRMDKEVDQSYAPVGIHKVKESFELKTSLAEATLANLKLVWEQLESVSEASPTRTLSWGMNPDCVEHTLVFKGKSPEGYDRTFTVLKAVVWDAGEVNHQKDKVTVIPVTFRILPDVTKAAGKEYGSIVDTMA
jgi:hypothetical protein